MDSRCNRSERCDADTADDVTSLLDDTVTVGNGVCDTGTGRHALAASAELVTLAVLTVTADVRLRRSNIIDDIVDDELDVLVSTGIELTG